MEQHELASWLLAIGLFTGPFLLKRLVVRRAPDGWLNRFGRWALDRLTSAPDPELSEEDQLAADLAAVLRRERLIRDADRVRRLLATDEWMSATRQIGNRMAYEQLLHELASVPQIVQPAPRAGAGTSWALNGLQGPGSTTPSSTGSSGYAPQQTRVETLDLGWRQ